MTFHTLSYFAWRKEQLRGTIAKGCTLIHVDAHPDDMPAGKLAPCTSLAQAKEQALSLWIDNFIHPLIRDRSIAKKCWVTPFWLEEFGTKAWELPGKEWFAGKDVLLSIDLDYFSCVEEPYHAATPNEIEAETKNLVKELQKRMLSPKVITIAASPDYTVVDDLPYASVKLLKALKKAGMWD